MFFGCKVAKKIWRTLKSDMGYGRHIQATMEDEMKWISSAAEGRNVQCDGVKLTYCVFIYWLWRSRSDNIFKSLNCTEAYIVHQIKMEVRMK